MKIHNNLTKRELQDIVGTYALWIEYWNHYLQPVPTWYAGQEVARMRKIKKHQIEARGRVRFVQWEIGEQITESQLEQMLNDSQLWYAYVEHHSYFIPQSYSRLNYSEKKALIINHQHMLREGKGEPVFKTEEDFAAACGDRDGVPATKHKQVQAGKFAMIFVAGGPKIPEAIHYTEESLNREAERLARETKQKVFILRPVEIKEVELAPVKSTLLTAFPVDPLPSSDPNKKFDLSPDGPSVSGEDLSK